MPAETRTFKAQFNVTPSATSTSTKRTWNFKYAGSEITTQAVQNFVNAMITNGSVFDNPPLSIVSAVVEEVTTTQILPQA